MKNTSERQKVQMTLCFSVMAALFVAGSARIIPVERWIPAWNAVIDSSVSFALVPPQLPSPEVAAQEEPLPASFEQRIAARLGERLLRMGVASPGLQKLTAAVAERQEILGRQVEVRLARSSGSGDVVWMAGPQRHPLWIKPEFSDRSAHFRLSAKEILSTLEAHGIDGVTPPTDITLMSIEERHGVRYGVTDGTARSGEVFDRQVLADAVFRALSDGSRQLSMPLVRQAGTIVNLTGEDLGSLSLLATGQSNFKGSGGGRIANVKKGLTEHVHNAIVPPGATFHFNDLLDAPVNQSKGWHMAYVIVDGKDLEMAPGGGICQVSTTFYRALLNAGIPIVERKPHSLYVTYYEQYGIGLDATIMPPAQDLVFRNDTPSALLVQATVDGFEAEVSIYGTPDGRTVELEGPHFAGAVPQGLHGSAPEIRSNEIGWVHRVRRSDGSVEENVILSRYRSLPRSVVKKYTEDAQSLAMGE